MQFIGQIVLLFMLAMPSCRTSTIETSDTLDLTPAEEQKFADFFAIFPDPLALIPGRYDDFMSFSEALLTMPEAEREQIVKGMIANLGFSLNAEQEKMLAYSIKEPKALSYILTQHSEQTLWDGFSRANQAFQSSSLAAETWILPNPLDLDTIDLSTISVPKSEPKQIGSNLWQWTPRSDLTDQQVRKNLIFAEVLNRLSDNLAKQGFPSNKVPDVEIFTVIYAGKSYDRVSDFLEALIQNGHKIRADVRVRAANFLELYSKRSDGQMRSVPVVTHHAPNFPINMNFLSTSLPEAHGELVFTISPSNGQSSSQYWQASVAFFQGIGGGTRFEQHGFLINQPWAGSRTVYEIPSSDAVNAVRASAFVRHLLRTTAFEENLRDYGYGYLGICSDAVTLVERALGRTATMMPQLFSEERVKTVGWRFESSTAASSSDKSLFKTLWNNRPFGNLMSSNARNRWKKTFMWKKGSEPFQIDQTARLALECSETSTDEEPCQ
jgi:hypothetical protein